jgi:nitroimidazol reductase NimA-like FMN-containing flavoprotein (pyridoxamine 5'-phosphate oxidase superfamily)
LRAGRTERWRSLQTNEHLSMAHPWRLRMTDPYHTRHPEKAMDDRDEILKVLREQRLLTVAMSMEGEPYLVTVNYAFDEGAECFYFHCAVKGKKIDYMKANPVVWCQVLEDDGYIQTECEHHFRTVQFRGKAEVLEDEGEIMEAVAMLIDQQEDEPEAAKARLLPRVKPEKMTMVRIRAEGFSGKKNEKAK